MVDPRAGGPDRSVPRGTRLRALAAAILGVLACAITPAPANAVEIVDEYPMEMIYTPAGDGTYWAVNSSRIYHLSAGGGIEDSFAVNRGGFFPQSIGVYGNRVYVMSSAQLLSFRTDLDVEPNPGLVFNDAETGDRFGGNQAMIRIAGNGVAAVALGQTNKVGMVDLTTVGVDPPFYGQSWFGGGVNDLSGQSNVFQACVISGPVAGGPNATCGRGFGQTGAAPGQFDRAEDVAFVDGGVLVLENDSHRVSFVATSRGGCPCADFVWGSGPGDAAGQLNDPASIVAIPGTGRVLISNVGSRRIDEFTTAGDYKRSFGFGVREGPGSEFETCGIGIGPCEAGVPYQQNPLSYFSQLDIVDGELLARTPLDNSIQIISLDGGAAPDKVKLAASPVRVKKGKTTTLTATLRPCPQSATHVLFQEERGSGWSNLGAKRKVNASCRATRGEKITKRTRFRAVSLASDGRTVSRSAPVNVTVKR
ncbi:hypothetical protein HJD18_14375 [Thermoleophilia bacterium SCSIO 60948]|nr:hypothetical protein HJD18_14375 [Thermoleophilia bacterium SCSIO 60948]